MRFSTKYSKIWAQTVFCTYFCFEIIQTCILYTESKPWREIYKEVRAEEEKRDPTPPPPVKRSLEDDFTDLDSTLTRSRSSQGRSALSPRTTISPTRERIIQGRDRISPDRDKISPGRDGCRERGWAQETPERQMSGVERNSRSRSKRSPQQFVPPLPLGEYIQYFG